MDEIPQNDYRKNAKKKFDSTERRFAHWFISVASLHPQNVNLMTFFNGMVPVRTRRANTMGRNGPSIHLIYTQRELVCKIYTAQEVVIYIIYT